MKLVHEDAGGSVSEDQLSVITGNSVRSSSFLLKVQALKQFQLLEAEKGGKHFKLSELARRIFEAVSPEQRAKALKDSFLSISQYRQLHEAYAGRLLPAGEFLLNAVTQHTGVPSQLTNQWKDSFIASGEAARLFQKRPDGKTQLRFDPEDSMERPPEEAPMLEAEEPRASIERQPKEQPQVQRDTETFRLPLFEGRFAVLQLPRGCTDMDIKRMVETIRVMFLWNDAEGRRGAGQQV